MPKENSYEGSLPKLRMMFPIRSMTTPCSLVLYSWAVLKIGGSRLHRDPGTHVKGFTHQRTGIFISIAVRTSSLAFVQTIRAVGVGRDSSVCIETRYGLDGPGIKSGGRGDENFCNLPGWPWGPPSLLYNGYRGIPGGKAAGTWR